MMKLIHYFVCFYKRFRIWKSSQVARAGNLTRNEHDLEGDKNLVASEKFCLAREIYF